MYEIYDKDDEDFKSSIDGVRHLVEYRGENLYVTIFPNKCEVFISSVYQDQDPLTGAAIDMASRMVTMAWKSNTLDLVIEQLKRSSRVTRDLPGILARLLSEEIE